RGVAVDWAEELATGTGPTPLRGDVQTGQEFHQRRLFGRGECRSVTRHGRVVLRFLFLPPAGDRGVRLQVHAAGPQGGDKSRRGFVERYQVGDLETLRLYQAREGVRQVRVSGEGQASHGALVGCFTHENVQRTVPRGRQSRVGEIQEIGAQGLCERQRLGSAEQKRDPHVVVGREDRSTRTVAVDVVGGRGSGSGAFSRKAERAPWKGRIAPRPQAQAGNAAHFAT